MHRPVNIAGATSSLRPSLLVVILVVNAAACLLPQMNAFGQRRGRAVTQRKTAPGGNTPAAGAAARAVTVPVADSTLERLPANYAGENGAAIYTALEKYKKQFVKSQFETTAAFRERVVTLLSQIRLDSGKTAADRLSFVIFDAGESYDADKQVFTLKLSTDGEAFDVYYPNELMEAFESAPREKPDPFLNFSSALNDGFVSVSLWHTSRTIGRGVGRNAFGVRGRYTIRSYAALRLAMWRANISRYGDETISFRATPAEARAASGHVFLAFTGRLRFPFIRYESDIDEATLTDLEEAHYQRYYIFFEPDSLIAYNGRTGEVLGSVGLPFKESGVSTGSVIMLNDRRHPEPKPETESTPKAKNGLPTEVSQPSPPSSAPVSEPPNRLVVSGGVLSGKAISKPPPEYPEIAKKARAQGAVVVQITVDEEGRVISASAISGNPLLQQAAVAAVRNWRFPPTMVSGQPVKVTGTVTVNFTLK
jgi:TonB family protein